MKKLILLAPCTALLFACGGGGASLQPGMWETTVNMSNIEVPGMPEEQAAAMRQAMARAQTQSQCITPQQAANPMAGMMGQQQGGCNFTKNTFAGGTIDIAGTCSPPGAGQVNMTMTGTYTGDTINSNVRMEMRPPAGTPGGPTQINMTGTVTSRRTGDCPAG